MKHQTDLAPQIKEYESRGLRLEGQISNEYELDPELYRIGMTPTERKQLVDLILHNQVVSQSISDKLHITDKMRAMNDFEVDH